MADINETVTENSIATESAKTVDLSIVLISLLKKVVYQEHDERLWSSLVRLQPRVREYVSVLGLQLILDEAEGYAFLRSRNVDDGENDYGQSNDDGIPRLVARRPLSFPVSLLMALLRKKLAEFDATGGDARLVLSRSEIIDLLRVFLPQSTNEVRVVTQVDSYIKKIEDLGFLRRLKAQSGQESTFEVKRILKAFVDAQWLSGLNQRLKEYQDKLTLETDDGEVEDDE